MTKKIVMLVVAAVTFAAIFCACSGGNASETSENSSDFESAGDLPSSDTDDKGGVVSDENGEWWEIEF